MYYCSVWSKRIALLSTRSETDDLFIHGTPTQSCMTYRYSPQLVHKWLCRLHIRIYVYSIFICCRYWIEHELSIYSCFYLRISWIIQLIIIVVFILKKHQKYIISHHSYTCWFTQQRYKNFITKLVLVKIKGNWLLVVKIPDIQYERDEVNVQNFITTLCFLLAMLTALIS